MGLLCSESASAPLENVAGVHTPVYSLRLLWRVWPLSCTIWSGKVRFEQLLGRAAGWLRVQASVHAPRCLVPGRAVHLRTVTCASAAQVVEDAFIKDTAKQKGECRLRRRGRSGKWSVTQAVEAVDGKWMRTSNPAGMRARSCTCLHQLNLWSVDMHTAFSNAECKSLWRFMLADGS